MTVNGERPAPSNRLRVTLRRLQTIRECVLSLTSRAGVAAAPKTFLCPIVAFDPDETQRVPVVLFQESKFLSLAVGVLICFICFNMF